MERYTIIAAEKEGSFAERLSSLCTKVGDYLKEEKLEGRQLHYTKIFLSDAQNQYQRLVESSLYQNMLGETAISVVEQAPVDGSKITLLIKTAAGEPDFLFHSLRLTDGETKGMNSYTQTIMLFEKYLRMMKDRNLRLDTHCVRTWIYVGDIDNNYAGVVKARNDIFNHYGLTVDTHFIASTGIGGQTQTRSECVAMDFLTFPSIKETDKTYLKALDYLSPTHEYGVAFERGTRLSHNGKQTFFISGTASIDKHGNVIYVGDVMRQANRLLENINALLKDGGAGLDNVKYFIVYLRDISDYEPIHKFMTERFPAVPHVIVQAKVCRPEWLIEMECIASKG
ncbi:MAG: translation initiation inhibitor [Prevotella sp.]|nr:translation initiation inhibitor [Prevotella sp.]